MMRLLLLLLATSTTVATALPPPILTRGWNLGNTLEEAPTPTNPYQPRIRKEWIFKAVKDQGFDWVRIPCQWGVRASEAAPFALNATFLAEVNETVHWALGQGLTVMVNAHDEHWIDSVSGVGGFATT